MTSDHHQDERVSALVPVTTLRGVGPRLAQRLARIGIHSVADVLFHLPTRYQDRTRIVPMGSVRPGMEVVVQGRVELTEIKFGRRRMLLSRISDGTGSLTLRFFHFKASQQTALARGTVVRCFGEVRPGAVTLELIHPEYEILADETTTAVAEHLTPLYPTTEGLHQLSLRNVTEQALVRLADDPALLPDWIPQPLLEQMGWPTLTESLRYVHRPPPDAPVQMLQDGLHPTQRRLAFEELLAHVLSRRRLREQARQETAIALQASGALSQRFLAALPFRLTDAQRRVAEEVRRDLSQDWPMQRLVQGDVGSGKTVVAALAVLQAVEAGYQAAVMAPTEILAEQHCTNFSRWLEPLGVTVEWLSGKLRQSDRRRALEALANGAARVAVGTHALFQEQVVFDDLALVVVDEQHRFGVHQRLALREKGTGAGRWPHQLIMTATPIPRTLAMTAYADLDCSVIDELPPGRTPVETVVIPDTRRAEVVARVRRACGEGRQAYWVCTLIEESEALQCQAAEDAAHQLTEALPELRVGLVHGRMSGDDKQHVMDAFKAAKVDLLVATTVIEVGVDVPNASLMIIENAERLGLAQLHQLRGRVGRGERASSCVLMYHGPLSQDARVRLGTMRESNDGFVIAQRDLELRGPGEVLGTRQTGELQFRIADLRRDQDLLPGVQRAVEELIRRYPQFVDPLLDRWVGQAVQYAHV